MRLNTCSATAKVGCTIATGSLVTIIHPTPLHCTIQLYTCKVSANATWVLFALSGFHSFFFLFVLRAPCGPIEKKGLDTFTREN